MTEHTMTEKGRYAGFKVLIVDDNPNNLFTLRSLIEKYTDVHVIEADGGEKAVNLALTENDVDLIILDVQMPEMDGFQTASMLKIRKKTQNIPIIFLTAAFKTDEFQQKGYELGAADYLLKPIDDNQLINKIGTYIRLIQQERQINVRLERLVRELEPGVEKRNCHTGPGEPALVQERDVDLVQRLPALMRLLIVASVSFDTTMAPSMIWLTNSPMTSFVHVFCVSSRAILPSSII